MQQTTRAVEVAAERYLDRRYEPAQPRHDATEVEAEARRIAACVLSDASHAVRWERGGDLMIDSIRFRHPDGRNMSFGRYLENRYLNSSVRKLPDRIAALVNPATQDGWRDRATYLLEEFASDLRSSPPGVIEKAIINAVAETPSFVCAAEEAIRDQED